MNPTLSVVAFLRSFGLTDAEQLRELASVLGADAHQKVAAWFQRTLPTLRDPSMALTLGRAAFLLSGAAEKNPRLFLADDVPADWAARLRAACPIPTPAETRGLVPEQSLAPPPLLQKVSRALVPAETATTPGGVLE